MFVTGTYEKNVADPVLIFARPFPQGSPAPKYGASDSPEYVDLQGTFEQDFCLRDDVTLERQVDQLRLFVERPGTGELLFEQFVDVDYLFTKPVSIIQQFGGSGTDEALGVATDASGNICVIGATSGDLDGSGNAGGLDMFLVKLAP